MYHSDRSVCLGTHRQTSDHQASGVRPQGAGVGVSLDWALPDSTGAHEAPMGILAAVSASPSNDSVDLVSLATGTVAAEFPKNGSAINIDVICELVTEVVNRFSIIGGLDHLLKGDPNILPLSSPVQNRFLDTTGNDVLTHQLTA